MFCVRLWVDNSFLSIIKNIVPLLLASVVFAEKLAVIKLVSLINKVSFFSGCFQELFFLFSFRKLNFGISWHDFFEFILLMVCSVV